MEPDEITLKLLKEKSEKTPESDTEIEIKNSESSTIGGNTEAMKKILAKPPEERNFIERGLVKINESYRNREEVNKKAL